MLFLFTFLSFLFYRSIVAFGIVFADLIVCYGLSFLVAYVVVACVVIMAGYLTVP